MARPRSSTVHNPLVGYAEPARDAVTYWQVTEKAPTDDDPLDALVVRLATAYEEPWLLKFHFDDVGSAAGRAAELAPASQHP